MRFRLSSGLTIVAVFSVLYAIYSVAGAGIPFGPGSTSSTCLPPSVAVDIYAQTFPGWQYGLNDTFTGLELEEHCTDVCKRWGGTCKGIAKDGQKCVNSYVSKSFKVFEEACKTESDSDLKKECRQNVKAEIKDLKNETRSDVGIAKGCCEDFRERCVLACITGNSTPYIEPTCSGIGLLEDISSCI